MGRHKKEIISTMKCLHCGSESEYKQFYKMHNSSNIYSGNVNHIPVCKDCMKILYEQYKAKYTSQFSILGTEPEENAIEKLAIRRLCMTFDMYYSDRLFDAALKQIDRFTTLDMVSAYMKIANLKQSRNKSYDDTIIEENLSQELLRCSMVDKIRGQFKDDELYQDIYDLCLKLLQSLKEKMDVEIENVDCETNDYNVNE